MRRGELQEWEQICMAGRSGCGEEGQRDWDQVTNYLSFMFGHPLCAQLCDGISLAAGNA